MAPDNKPEAADVASLWGDLVRYSRPECDLLNWACGVLSFWSDIQSWLQPQLQGLIKKPVQHDVLLSCRQKGQTAVEEFVCGENGAIIGRDAHSQILLANASVSRKHAQISMRGMSYVVEDLGSAVGTLLNGIRLSEPQRLKTGDQLTIFPFTFDIEIRRRWLPEDRFRFYPVAPNRTNSLACLHARSSAWPVRIDPFEEAAFIAFENSLLEELRGRVPTEAEGDQEGASTDCNSALVQRLVAPVIARLQTRMPFPCVVRLDEQQLTTLPREPEPGFGLGLVMELSGVRGYVRIFVPDTLLERLRAECPALSGIGNSAEMSWAVQICLGSTSVTCRELAGLEITDVILVDPAPILRLPHWDYRGWTGRLESLAPLRLVIKSYEERSVLMSSQDVPADPARAPEQGEGEGSIPKELVDNLPVTVHVVLTEREFKLSELSSLRTGAILELDRSRTDPVSLAANGRILAKGELVEVEGRLGVRILSWV